MRFSESSSIPARTFGSRPGPALLALVLLAASACAPTPRGEPAVDHVILITIDTLRADHLGAYGYPRPTSPFIDGLAARGVLFEDAVSAASHTAPAHASIFTSLYPAFHGLLRNGETLDPSLQTLAGVFARRGFETAAFTAVSFLEGLRAGFDHFDSNPPVVNRLTYRLPYRPAGPTIEHALDWMLSPDRGPRTFVWLHFYEVHEAVNRLEGVETPVREESLTAVRAPLRDETLREFLVAQQAFPEEIVDTELVDRYDSLLLDVDRALGELYVALPQDRQRRTLWIVTADHGEGLYCHGYVGHGMYLYREQIHTPLIFHFPDGRYGAARVAGLVSHVDLLPTLAELIGAPLAQPVQGRSLMPQIATQAATDPDRRVMSQRRPRDAARLDWEAGEIVALRTRRQKYIMHSQGDDELFDLAADPHELRNLAAEQPETVAELRGKLEAMLVGRRELPTGDPLEELSPEKIEELKSLGYL